MFWCAKMVAFLSPFWNGSLVLPAIKQAVRDARKLLRRC